MMTEKKARDNPFVVVGHSVPKIDTLEKVLRRTVYSEDMTFPGMLCRRVLRAGIPYTCIKRVVTSRAEAMDGVATVLTARDIKGRKLYGIAFQDQPALAEDKVRYIGDPVALVAAENNEIARDTVKAIGVEYKELPAVTNAHQGMTEGAPKVHNKGNLILHSKTRKGNVE